MIQRTGYYVNFYGDPEVGIFDAEWELRGEFFFDTPEEEQQFKQKLEEAFEYCSDTPIGVESFEERQSRIEAENQLFFTPPAREDKIRT